MRLRLHWGVGVTVLYTAFAMATLGFVIFAVSHPAALVSADYYQAAARHDRRIEATANGRAAGASLALGTDPAGVRTATLRLTPAHHGRSVGTVTWYRPSDASFDRALPLAVDAEGVQRMGIGDLASGHWRVKVEWDVEGRPFYFEQAVMVAP